MKNLEVETLASLFKALSDENRLQMLAYLCSCKQGQNVGELSSCCDIDLSVVSRHLSKLKNAGVLKADKEGKQVFYSLEKDNLVSQLRALADFIESAQCC
jgi:DNA-binding transcriptional ArsR family regulator